MWGGGPPTGDDDPFPHFHFQNDIFKEMEEMMKIFEHNAQPFLHSPHVDNDVSSLRDHILKSPDTRPNDPQLFRDSPSSHSSNPFDSLIENFFGKSFHQLPVVTPLLKTDIDLDARIAEEGVKAVLKNDVAGDDSIVQPRTYSNGYFRSESTIRSSDGTIEKRITERDVDGNETTTVTVERPDGSTDTKTFENERSISEGSTQNNNSLHDLITGNRGKVLPDPQKDNSLPSEQKSMNPFSIISSISSAMYDIFKGKN